MASSAMDFAPTEAHALAGASLLLSRLWANEVDRELLCRLRADPTLNQLQLPPESHNPDDDTNWLEELAVDFCAIMIGPGAHAAPVQSVWSQGSISGRATDLMRDFLNCVEQDQIPVPRQADHFANQLYVAGRLLSAVGDGAESSGFSHDLVSAFWSDHVRWARPMVRKAKAIANTDFYAAMADLTGMLLDEGDRFFKSV